MKRNKKYIKAGFLLLLVIMFMGASYALKEEKKEESMQGEKTASVEEGNLLIASLPAGQGTTYFFRGTHEDTNNNVIWAGHQWKILRVEPNGTVRMLYNGKCTLNAAQTNCTEGINDSGDGAAAHLRSGDGYGASVEFNSSYDHNRFVGYMYGEVSGTFAQQHANTNSSTIKTRVEAWFNNDANISEKAREQTVPTTFCMDRRVYTDGTYSGDGTGSDNSIHTMYARGRIYVPANVIPTLDCPREGDRETLRVGLITADEVLVAGLTSTSANSASATNKNVFVMSGAAYWTMTPFFFNSGYAYVFYVNPSGNLSNFSVSYTFGVRPVLALSSSVTTSSGDGSASSPFVVVTPQ